MWRGARLVALDVGDVSRALACAGGDQHGVGADEAARANVQMQRAVGLAGRVLQDAQVEAA
jgi:hypothetical protein